MSSLKRPGGAAVLAYGDLRFEPLPPPEANPDGVVRTYNTYPGRITGMSPRCSGH